MARPKGSKNYTPERKGRILDLFFRAMAMDWPTRKFARWSRVPTSTINTWLLEDGVFEQYRRAMERKAFALPQRADDVVKQLLAGEIEAKTAGVVLRHLEFRLMREFKGGVYQTQKQITHKTDVTDLTDDQIEERFNELRAKANDEVALEKSATRH